MANGDNLLQDFPSSTLDKYRNQASFDWKKLKILIEDEFILKTKVGLVSSFNLILRICQMRVEFI